MTGFDHHAGDNDGGSMEVPRLSFWNHDWKDAMFDLHVYANQTNNRSSTSKYRYTVHLHSITNQDRLPMMCHSHNLQEDWCLGNHWLSRLE